MERLKVEKFRDGLGVSTMKVTGFTAGELKELGSMEHCEMEEAVLDMLDAQGGGLGTQWKCGYGIYGITVGQDAVYVEVGSSCD